MSLQLILHMNKFALSIRFNGDDVIKISAKNKCRISNVFDNSIFLLSAELTHFIICQYVKISKNEKKALLLLLDV